MKKLFTFLFLLSSYASAQQPKHYVTLIWTASADATVDSVYTIYRGDGDCTLFPVMQNIGTVSVSTTFEDDNVKPATTYCYSVTETLPATGESGPSNLATATTNPDAAPAVMLALVKP